MRYQSQPQSSSGYRSRSLRAMPLITRINAPPTLAVATSTSVGCRYRTARFTGQTGLRDGGKRGPLGLILVSLTLDPTAGRAAAAAAGHGFVPGWTLAIIGDMIYFVLLMASTLWVSSVVGDDRVTLGAVLLAMWLVPFLILTVIHLLVLGAEIGGICFALHLVTGLPLQVWALPVAVLVWLFLWRATFKTIENSTSLLGLITLAFVVAAAMHHPPTHEVLAGALPPCRRTIRRTTGSSP